MAPMCVSASAYLLSPPAYDTASRFGKQVISTGLAVTLSPATDDMHRRNQPFLTPCLHVRGPTARATPSAQLAPDVKVAVCVIQIACTLAFA